MKYTPLPIDAADPIDVAQHARKAAGSAAMTGSGGSATAGQGRCLSWTDA